jgi:hypothetical protein
MRSTVVIIRSPAVNRSVEIGLVAEAAGEGGKPLLQALNGRGAAKLRPLLVGVGEIDERHIHDVGLDVGGANLLEGASKALVIAHERTIKIENVHSTAHSPTNITKAVPWRLSRRFARWRIVLTCTGLQAPPRAVGMPRAANALATPCRV